MLTESHCRPGENSLANDIRSSAVDYILTACPCAARGVETLLNAEKRCCVIIMTGNRDGFADWLCKMTSDSRVVVYLPNELISMLTTLQELSLLCRLYSHPLSVLILSTARPEWLYSTLRALTGGGASLAAMRIVSPEISLQSLARMLKTWSQIPLLAEQERNSIRGEGITSRELDVVLNQLLGENIITQEKRLGVSCKTLYSRRISGLRKLTDQFPYLTNLLPRQISVNIA